MSAEGSIAASPEDEIVPLVAVLHQTQQRLQQLAGGEVDAVVHSGGFSYLLHDAQERLRQSEAIQQASAATLSSILNALPAHIALLNWEGEIMSVNEGWLDFATGNSTGHVPSQIGQNYLEICESAAGDCAREAHKAAGGIRDVLAGGIREFSMEYACHSPTEKRWYQLIAVPIGESGRGGAVVMHTDITARKLAQDAVLESESRFRGMFTAAATGIAVSTLDGRFLQVNEAYCKMLGYTNEEMLQRNFASLTHPDDLSLNLKLRDELLAGQRESFVMEKRYFKKNGDIVWTRHSVSATRGEMGKPTTLVVVAEDITERKMAAEELRRSASLLSMASRVGRTGAWVLEFPASVLTWSAGMRAIHEVPPDYQPNYLDGIEFYLPEFRDKVRATVQRCAEKGESFDFEAQIKTAKGKVLWVRAIGERVRSADAAHGVNTRLQGAFQDITEIKQREHELNRINRALKMLSNCNESLIRAENEQELLDRICRIAIEDGGYRMACVGYAAQDDSRLITPVAHSGAEDGYLSEIRVTWNENEPSGMGIAGRVVRSGVAEVCEDITKDPNFSLWTAVALEHGYRSAIALPLKDEHRTFGILALHSAEENPYSPAEMKLLKELADDLAFGILNLRTRNDKRRVEAAVLKVATGVSAATGAEFFEHLAVNMADALGAQAGFLARMLPGEPVRARAIGAVAEGIVLSHFDYSLAGAPCEELLHEESVVIERNVAGRYPGAGTLVKLQAEGYAGRRLVSSTGEHLGLVYVIFRKPIEHVEFVTSTLRIFAARAAAELEREQTEMRLREQARLLDVAHDAIRVDSLDSSVLYWNRGSERVYGWDANEALGRRSDEMLNLDADDSLKAVKALVAHGEWRGEATKRTKDGRTIIVDVHWTLVRDEEGKPKAILAIDTDITDRKRLEEQFLRAQRLESIGTLASGLAHDLNNILAPITMCAPLLRNDLAPKDKEKIVSAIESSASRGAKIISQVLTFGRGETGVRRSMQIAGIIEEIKQVADGTFPKNIRVETSIAAGMHNILGDATQWHQVLMNLSVNARDAMPEGGILRISAENLLVDAQYASMVAGLSEGPHIVIEVADTGSGIPPEVAERMFDPFFTTKEVGKGTGLGLSTVLGIVKSHGGVINLVTHQGKGTTFRILVPADNAQEEETGPQAPPAPGQGETVLIADDEEHVRNAARAILESHGYHALVAADGTEALALYARHSVTIDAVLTDITMPFMDGIALMKALQRLRPGLPLIASTGQHERVRDLKILGLITILKKPYTAELLLQALNAAMKAQRARAAS